MNNDINKNLYGSMLETMDALRSKIVAEKLVQIAESARHDSKYLTDVNSEDTQEMVAMLLSYTH